MELKRLTSDDWDELIQGAPITLGKTTIIIQPLGIAELKRAKQTLQGLIVGIKAKGIVTTDLDTDEGKGRIFDVVMEQAPELLELASGLHRDDIARLPIAKGVELLKVIMEVNINSQDSLLKNFVALGELIKGVGSKTLAEAQGNQQALAGE